MTTSTFRRFSLALLTLVTAALLAVGGCATDPGIHDGGFEDTDPRRPDPGNTPTGTEAPQSEPTGPGQEAPEGTVIEFVTPQSVNVQQESRTPLTVRLLNAGEPVADVNIDFEIPSAQQPLAGGSTLAQRRARTGDDGHATVELRSGEQAAQFQVRVSVPSNSDVESVNFVVRVASKDSSDYRIQAVYDGPRDLERVELFLFDERPRQCSSINSTWPNSPGDGETALISDELNVGNGNHIPVYTYVVDLAEEPLQYVIAYGIRNNQAVAYGCADELPVDNIIGAEVDVEVPMRDLYPSVAGRYDVDTELSIYDALPSNIRVVLDLIFDFFEDPAGAVVGLIEQIAGSSIPASVRPFVIGLINDLLEQVLPQGYLDVRDTALDVRNILQNFELSGQITIVSEADENGLLPGPNNVLFDAIYIEFQGDRTAYDLGVLGYRPIEGEFAGSIQLGQRGSGFEHALQIDPFSMDFRYGQILTFIIENILLPELFGVEGFGNFIREFIDCDEIAQSCGGLSNTCRQICNSAIDALADTIRDQLLRLETDTTNRFILQTPEGEPCPLIDNNDNFRIDAMGRATPRSARCQWHGEFRWNVNEPTAEQMPGNFYGTRR